MGRYCRRLARRTADTVTSYTDTNGNDDGDLSFSDLRAAGGGSFFNPFAQTTITATAGSASATFYLTQVLAVTGMRPA